MQIAIEWTSIDNETSSQSNIPNISQLSFENMFVNHKKVSVAFKSRKLQFVSPLTSLTPQLVVLLGSGVPLVVVGGVGLEGSVSGVQASCHGATSRIITPLVGVGGVPVADVVGVVSPLAGSHPVGGSNQVVHVLGTTAPHSVDPLNLSVAGSHVGVVQVEFTVSLGGTLVTEVEIFGYGPDGSVVVVN